MAKRSKEKVTVNLKKMQKKIHGVGVQNGRRELADQVLKNCNPFVPYKSGDLADSGLVSSDFREIVWDEPYALAQYKGIVHGSDIPDRADGRGKHWDEKAAAIYMNDWKKAYLKGADIS